MSKSITYSDKEGKNPVIAGLLSILLGGAGQIYIGQVMKGWLLIAISLFVLVISAITINFFCIIPTTLVVGVGMLDAFLVSSRLRKDKSIHSWEFFWSARQEPFWQVVNSELVDKNWVENFTVVEKRRFMNESTIELNQKIRLSKEWSQTYSVEYDKNRAVTNFIEPKITNSALMSRAIQDELREKRIYTENSKFIFEQEILISVPANTSIMVEFHWKEFREKWKFSLSNQYRQETIAYVSVLTNVTFDQRQCNLEQIPKIGT